MLSAIIVAAGESGRFGGAERKPFALLAGEPLLVHACRACRQLPECGEIIVVLREDDRDRVLDGPLFDALDAAGMTMAVTGGDCRAASVWAGLEVMSAMSDLVAVHDAARPFLSADVAKVLVEMARKRGAAVPAIPMADTVKRVEGDVIVETPRRLGLVRVQTPQVFKSDLLIDAFEYAIGTGGLSGAITDDAALVEAFGQPVATVYGDEAAIKITTRRDLALLEAWLAAHPEGGA